MINPRSTNAQTMTETYLSVLERFVCDMIYSIVYSALYLFSTCQIKYNQISKYIFFNPFSTNPFSTYPFLTNPFSTYSFLTYPFSTNPLSKSTKGPFEVFIKGLKEPVDETITETIGMKMKMDENVILLYSDIQPNGQQNKVMIRNGDELSASTTHVNYKCANYSFISVELVLEDGTVHKILLNNGDDNYYIVGNVVDKTFIAYYTKKYLNFEEAPEKYTLNIVDNDANFFAMTQDDSIKIHF